MLTVEKLTVSVKGRIILNSLDLHIRRGETAVLFGPNGSGKTSLLKTLFGFPGYSIQGGRMWFMGKDITGLPVDERARMGMGMAYQRPPSVRGVKLGDLIKICSSETDSARILERLNLTAFEERELNLGFSGGEIKRSELAQLLSNRPRFVMLDEPDSGVDLVSIHLVGEVIRDLLEKDIPQAHRDRAGLIISHTGHILDYVQADRGYLLFNGRIRCSGEPADLLEDIRILGYEGCARCQK
jgi:Fe-S cluster assembly ATP-binding protein